MPAFFMPESLNGIQAFFNTRLRKLIKLQIDECMAETGEFSLTVRCHAPLVTSETGIIPRGDLICTQDNSAITGFSASVFPIWRSRNGKGNQMGMPHIR